MRPSNTRIRVLFISITSCLTLAVAIPAAIGMAQDRRPAVLGAQQKESPLIRRAQAAAAKAGTRDFFTPSLGAGKENLVSREGDIADGISRITGLIPPVNLLDQARRADAESRAINVELGRAPVARLGASSLPRRWSWRAATPSIVTPSRDQGSTNACWAFATVGAFESAYAKANTPSSGMLNAFSEQAVIDCSGAGTARSGGWWAFAYLRDLGATPYNQIPYTGRDPSGTPASCGQRTNFRALNFSYVEPDDAYYPDRALIKAAIYEHGPIVAGVFATDRFMSHMNGSVFSERRGYDRSIGANHAIVIIGWNDDQGAWIVKNSYGPGNWGVSGFGYVAYETNNIGFGAAWVDAVERQQVGAQLGAMRAVIPSAANGEDVEDEGNSDAGDASGATSQKLPGERNDDQTKAVGSKQNPEAKPSDAISADSKVRAVGAMPPVPEPSVGAAKVDAKAAESTKAVAAPAEGPARKSETPAKTTERKPEATAPVP